MKIVKQSQLKIGIFTAVKNRCILHGRVFVIMYMCIHFSLVMLGLRGNKICTLFDHGSVISSLKAQIKGDR